MSKYRNCPNTKHCHGAAILRLCITSSLKKHDNGTRIVFDPKTPDIDERVFNSSSDWRDFFRDVCKELSPNMPEPKG